jgi:hypothetical protein
MISIDLAGRLRQAGLAWRPGGTFRRLERTPAGYRATAMIEGAEVGFTADDPADAYGAALLSLIETVSKDVVAAG